MWPQKGIGVQERFGNSKPPPEALNSQNRSAAPKQQLAECIKIFLKQSMHCSFVSLRLPPPLL
jgi:hypothetical protein